MSGRGRTPKLNPLGRGSRRFVECPRGADVVVPELPGSNLRPETQAWFQAVVNSSVAAQFEAADWQRVLMILPMREAYLRVLAKGDTLTALKLSAELRLLEAPLGLVLRDRMVSRVAPVKPAPIAAQDTSAYDPFAV